MSSFQAKFSILSREYRKPKSHVGKKFMKLRPNSWAHVMRANKATLGSFKARINPENALRHSLVLKVKLIHDVNARFLFCVLVDFASIFCETKLC